MDLATLTAQFWKLRADEITDDLRFDGRRLKNFSSTRFLSFLGAVEGQLGVRVADPAAITSFGALRAAAGTLSKATNVPVVQTTQTAQTTEKHIVPPASPSLGAMALGHDVEEIATLPQTDDFAAHAFYRANFTPSEIAYAAGMADPRKHFAARLCAKEALMKASAACRAIAMSAIEVTTDADGRPSLRVLDAACARALQGAAILVSLSHTDTIASAVVIVVSR